MKRPAVLVLGPHRIAASYSVERLADDVRGLYADLFAGKHADALH